MAPRTELECERRGIGGPDTREGAQEFDVAALRRHLVDDGFLGRAAGEYWRAGGSVR